MWMAMMNESLIAVSPTISNDCGVICRTGGDGETCAAYRAMKQRIEMIKGLFARLHLRWLRSCPSS